MALVSIQRSVGVAYPTDGDISPTRRSDENLLADNAERASRVYALVRDCLRSYQTAAGRTAAQNEYLKPWIKPGDRVWVLPNVVMHRRLGESVIKFRSKCTHGSVVRAIVDYAVHATHDASRVSVGNAPIQSCDYARATRESGMAAVTDFYRQLGYPQIGPYDLRSFSSRRTWYGALLAVHSAAPDDAVAIDLGEDSLMEELFQEQEPLLRIGDYPPDSIMTFHSRGKHVYVLSRSVLEADVIISAPKLKTHQKVGITGALKCGIGTVARKECLAHHRKGGPEIGGDEYPKSSLFRWVASELSDLTGSLDTSFTANAGRVLGKAYIRLLRVGRKGTMGGAWYGNDTAWRMALDIARILRYGRPDGTLSDEPFRRLIGFVDGIVGGEGDGPLRPQPHYTGAVLFCPDVCSLDASSALIMGFDPEKIPLIKSAFADRRYRLTEEALSELSVTLNGRILSQGQLLQEFHPPYKAAKGWRGHIEAEATGRGPH